MTNETTQNKKRLLIVEDNPNYALNAYRTATARGYDADVAFDLKDAMTSLQSRQYSGVITDLEFCEEGIRNPKMLEGDESPLSGLEKSLLDTFKRKTSEFKENTTLREQIANELATPENARQMKELCCEGYDAVNINYGSLTLPEIQSRMHKDIAASTSGMSGVGSPMGYEVIKAVKKLGIPFSIVTSLGHGHHCLPALLGLGITTSDKLLAHADLNNLDYTPLFEQLQRSGMDREQMAKIATVTETSSKLIGYANGESFGKISIRLPNGETMDVPCNLANKMISLDSGYPTALERRAKNVRILQNLADLNRTDSLAEALAPGRYDYRNQEKELTDSVFLDNAIILRTGSKDQPTYDWAIDQIEGKIQETRPYQLVRGKY